MKVIKQHEIAVTVNIITNKCPPSAITQAFSRFENVPSFINQDHELRCNLQSFLVYILVQIKVNANDSRVLLT